MAAVAYKRPALAAIELGAFRGILTIDAGGESEFFEIGASDLVGRGRNLWIVPASGGRTVKGRHGRGSRIWSAIFQGLHGRPVTETRMIRAKPFSRSARYLGEALNIFYQPRREDRTFKRNRRHVFSSPRPQLYGTGSDLFVVGGSFRVTERGIVG